MENFHEESVERQDMQNATTYTVDSLSVNESTVEYKQSYSQNNIGCAGDYSVNNRTGEVTLTKQLFSLKGEHLPLSMNLVYRQKEAVSSDSYTGFPIGWKLNCQQYIYASGSNFIYVDGEYCRHVFKPITSGSLYYDSDRTGLLLRIVSGVYTITDDRTLSYTFTNGKLSKITVKNGSTAMTNTIAYNGSNMTITDGMGRIATVVINSGSIAITKPDGKAITLTVTNNLLSKITEADGNIETYSYNMPSTGCKSLSTLTSYTGHSVQFTYLSDKVAAISEYIGGNIVLNKRFTYGASSTTIVTRRNSSSDSQGAETMNYYFAVNGDFVASYENVNSSCLNMNIASQSDYEKFNLNVAGAETYIGHAANSTTNRFTVSSSAEGVFDSVSAKTKDLVLWARANVLPSSSATAYARIHVYMEGATTPLATLNFNMNVNGEQIALIPIPLTKGNIGKFKIEVSGTTAVVLAVGISRKNKLSQVDCLNVNTGSGFSYAETVSGSATIWYELIDCKINGVSDAIKMTKDDWLLTLENYAKNNASFVLWYNDLTCAKLASSGTQFIFGNAYYGISGIKLATVSLQYGKTVFEYNTYGGSNYIEAKKQIYYGASSYRGCSYYYNTYYQLVKTVDSYNITTTYTYNEYGDCTSVTKSDGSGNNICSSKTYSNGFLSEEKEYVSGSTNTTSYSYNTADGNCIKVTSPRALSTSYTYAANAEDLTSVSATVGSENKNTITYNSKRLPSEISHNGFSYSFSYDGRNNVTQAALASNALCSNTYDYTANTNGTYTVETTWANSTGENNIFQKTYDKYGDLIEKKYKEGSTYKTLTKTYGAAGSNNDSNFYLKKTVDNGVTFSYNYDSDGRLHSVEKDNTAFLEYSYDDYNRVERETKNLNGLTETINYSYRDGDALNDESVSSQTISFNGFTYTSSNTYDTLNRLSGHKVTVTGNYYVDYSSSYTGASVSGISSNTTSLINMYRATLSSGSAYTDWYTYDANGNILTIYGQGGNNQTSYSYDALNRLTRENNVNLNKTYVYEYDAGGNITSKREYGYTEGTPATATNTYNYMYDSSRKDRLSRVVLNGASKYFIYDAVGNPTTYKNESMTWKYGRLLTGYTHNGTSCTFDYDGNGIRNIKTAGDTTTLYVYDQGRLLYERRRTSNLTSSLYYMYDETGLIGFVYGGTQYYYRKNAQGDILSIHSANGLFATYNYDAWGNCTVTDNSGTGIGDINPFRYRGYYYDTETGLYYLMTRYYDPEICRFVNADALSYIQPSVINGCNLYAYCNNNPVTGYDPDGTFDWGKFWDIATNIIAAWIAVAVVVSTGNLIDGINIFGSINNVVNFVYYTWISDGNSSLTNYSYSGNDGDSSIYLTRWQRLDYTKQQLQNSWYTPNAWRYYSEYSLHMYGWLITSKTFLGNIGVVSGAMGSLRVADLDMNNWDGRWFVDIPTIFLGLLGI